MPVRSPILLCQLRGARAFPFSLWAVHTLCVRADCERKVSAGRGGAIPQGREVYRGMGEDGAGGELARAG